MVGCNIHSQGDPGKKAVFNGVTKVGILKERIRVAILGLHLDNTAVCILGNRHGAGVIGVGSLNFIDQVLVKEELTNVRNIAASQHIVGPQRCIEMRDNMNVRYAARIMSREDSL